MSRLIIYPYKLGSRSAIALQDVFTSHRALRVRPDGRYAPYRNHVILNWGSSTLPNWWDGVARVGTQVINQPSAVEVASNKLLAFEKMKEAGVSVPEFTTDRAVAIEWVNDNKIVVARKLLRGSEGRGIVIIEKEAGVDRVDNIEHAPLYVQYVKKEREFRIHCFKNSDGEMQVIDVQEKKTRQGAENINYLIQNTAGGFIFAREGVDPPAQVLEEAKKAVVALDLTFGATDIIYNRHYNKAYVIEVNCAPGLQNTSIEVYKNAILRFMES